MRFTDEKLQWKKSTNTTTHISKHKNIYKGHNTKGEKSFTQLSWRKVGKWVNWFVGSVWRRLEPLFGVC